jgi:putative flippase GtrA
MKSLQTRFAQHASVFWFGVVGALAALTHYCVAVLLEYRGASAHVANISGFLSAFPVSYFGHRFFSFASQKSPHHLALPKFFLVAVSGFVANHLMLLALLTFTSLPFWLALAIVMVVVAVSTYFLSRFWAFKSA